jgi:hypothetical protein
MVFVWLRKKKLDYEAHIAALQGRDQPATRFGSSTFPIAVIMASGCFF